MKCLEVRSLTPGRSVMHRIRILYDLRLSRGLASLWWSYEQQCGHREMYCRGAQPRKEVGSQSASVILTDKVQVSDPSAFTSSTLCQRRHALGTSRWRLAQLRNGR
jgi:hypothetical protein